MNLTLTTYLGDNCIVFENFMLNKLYDKLQIWRLSIANENTRYIIIALEWRAYFDWIIEQQ
jgi:hypothetical protein